MQTLFFSLTSVDEVKAFCAAAAALPCEVDARSGRYVVNAKSILGLFSMDLSAPVEVVVHGGAAHAENLKNACAGLKVTDHV